MIAGSVLPAIIDRFAQLCPRVVLDAETRADTSALLTWMLNDRSLDLVLARSVRGRTADEFGEDFHKEILFDDELVVIAGSGHHLARRPGSTSPICSTNAGCSRRQAPGTTMWSQTHFARAASRYPRSACARCRSISASI